MKHPISIFLFWAFIVGKPLFAQVTAGPKKYWITFKDKSNSPYSINTPEQFLSEAALKRRQLQNIPIKENDLPVNQLYVDQIQNLGVQVISRSKWFNAITIQVEDSSILSTINNLPFVNGYSQVARLKAKTAADDFMADLRRVAEATEAKQRKANSTQTKSAANSGIYGAANVQIEMIGGSKLHEMGFTGKGMTIAVLDAGFYNVDQINHFDSLRQSGRLLGTKDFVQGGTQVFEDNSHGMSVLSTMAANTPGEIVGTAPQANYWLLRTEEAATEFIIEEYNWVAGAEFADSVGAWIINSSLGYTRFDDTLTSHTYNQLDGNTTPITIGADLAASKGILVINSAGNSGGDAWRFIGAPADGDSVLTIGAVNSERAYASFSSRGPSVDGRIKPNVCAMGQQSVLVVSSGEVARSNGTSFSSPILAGMAACLWQAHPTSSAMEIFKAIEQSADQYENPDDMKGFGIPDFMEAHSILARTQLNQSASDSIVNVFPNPFIEGLSLEFFSTTEQEITVTVHKLSGKRVYEEKIKVYPFVNNLIQLEKLKKVSSGTYTVSVNNGKNVFVKRIIKG
jgi:subtilisin family serine protease